MNERGHQESSMLVILQSYFHPVERVILKYIHFFMFEQDFGQKYSD